MWSKQSEVKLKKIILSILDVVRIISFPVLYNLPNLLIYYLMVLFSNITGIIKIPMIYAHKICDDK